MCKYCSENKYISDEYFLIWIRDKLMIVENPTSITFREIIYCPICGEKLKNE
jgi:hypothetical protein